MEENPRSSKDLAQNLSNENVNASDVECNPCDGPTAVPVNVRLFECVDLGTWDKFGRLRQSSQPLPTEDPSDEGVVVPPPSTSRSHWVALLFGQGIALIAAAMNATSYTLVKKYNVQTQLFQLFWLYILLSLHLLLGIRKQRSEELVNAAPRNEDDSEPERTLVSTEELYSLPFLPCCYRIRLRIPWRIYFGISLLDLVPNFMALISFRYTSLTSSVLLGSLTVPSTMFFSRHLLSKVFQSHHYVGVLLCVLGGSLTVCMDVLGGDPSSSGAQSHSYIGDLLAIASALTYGLGDSVCEYSVKHIDRNEYLGMIGLFGALLTGITFPFIEYEALKDLFNISTTSEKLQVGGLMLCFILSVFSYYLTAARFLVSSDATLLNLSLQSVNLWAFVFTIASSSRDGEPPWSFYLALLLVIAGNFVYEMGIGRCQNCGESDKCRRISRSSSGAEIVQEQERTICYESLILN